MASLGLADYGSDEEENMAQQEEGHEPVALLGSYRSGDNSTLASLQGINAAPAIQEPAQEEEEDAYGSPQPQTSGGEQEPSGALESTPGPEQVEAASIGLAALPPELRQPPPGECDPRTVEKLRRILETSHKQRRSFIESLRSHRDYSNPDLLQQLVETYGLEEYGTAFDAQVFDPTALPKDDYLDALLQAAEQEQERRRVARASAPPGAATINFERGAGAFGILPASASNPNFQAAIAAVQTAAANAGRPPVGSLLPAHAAAMLAQTAQAAAAGRKRSKWDSAK